MIKMVLIKSLQASREDFYPQAILKSTVQVAWITESSTDSQFVLLAYWAVAAGCTVAWLGCPKGIVSKSMLMVATFVHY